MKKLLSTVALGLVVSLGASAATPGAVHSQIMSQKSNTLHQMKPVADKSMLKSAPVAKKNRPVGKKVASQEDFLGMYQWVGNDVLNDPGYSQGMFSIDVNPDNPDRVMVTGLDPWLEYLDGYVENGRLYIPNQQEGIYQELNQQIWFLNYTVVNGIDTDEVTGEQSPAYFFTKSSNPFYFSIGEDGYLYAGTPLDEEKFDSFQYSDEELAQEVCIASSALPYYDPDGQGYFYGFWLCAWITGAEIPIFEYNEDEWTYIGEADFQEPWFQVWYEGEAPIYPVPVYRNKEADAQFMLKAPFGPGTPWEDVTEGTEPGYILFSIGDPNCVLVQPLVYSLTLPLNITGDGSQPYQVFCYNMEGFEYVFNQETTDDIKLNFTMDRMNVSNFDATTRTVSLYNARFSVKQALLNQLYYDENSEGFIVLPENYDGVKTIGMEDANAAVEYFNLQGMKVQNPQKGQVVIVRQGNKASKQIAK